MVRHRILIPVYVGSIPSSPAKKFEDLDITYSAAFVEKSAPRCIVLTILMYKKRTFWLFRSLRLDLSPLATVM